jgi:ABC-type uncharacterized transport system permease subunit
MRDVDPTACRLWVIATKAGTVYFALVFGAGFILGTLRVLIVTPKLGESVAVALELPVMLALSWVACSWVTARLDVPEKWTVRLSMGAYAFSVLMLAELGISTLMLGRSVLEHLGHYRELPALLGLVAQILFAFFPLLQTFSRLSLGARLRKSVGDGASESPSGEDRLAVKPAFAESER